MKTRILGLLMFVGLALMALTWPNSKPNNHTLITDGPTQSVEIVSTVDAATMGCAQCVTDRNACNAACNGNAECLSICQAEYECCLITCHGGSCRKAQSADQHGTKR